ncbi:MAG: hypothetical protein F4089_08570 [Gammaproteobacteria bacterium]|nr:hypothetical protein [Gammaproteobacteria bacterium]
MKRSELEHVIRAAAAILDVEDIVVVGSQSVLGRYPEAPAELLESCEADIYPRGEPSRSAIIDAVIGEESRFHETFGYYVDGVDEKTSVLPPGWEQRLVRVVNENTRGAVGWCLDPEDLALAKHVAGRDKDNRFTQALVRHRMVDRDTLLERLDSMELPAEKRAVITGRIAAQFAAARE